MRRGIRKTAPPSLPSKAMPVIAAITMHGTAASASKVARYLPPSSLM
jgi:hypothetical protein